MRKIRVLPDLYRQMFMQIVGVVILMASLTGAAYAGGNLQAFKSRPASPGFSLPDLDGEVLDLASMKGKTVVVNFWATWCPPCRAEMPSMERASSKLKDDNVVIVGVHVGGNEDKVWTFVTEHNLTFPIVLDKGGATSRKWPMRGLPTTFVVDPKGAVAYQAIGGREWDDPAILDVLRTLAKGE